MPSTVVVRVPGTISVNERDSSTVTAGSAPSGVHVAVFQSLTRPASLKVSGWRPSSYANVVVAPAEATAVSWPSMTVRVSTLPSGHVMSSIRRLPS